MALSDSLLKLWIWTKIILLALVVIYLLAFAWSNSGDDKQVLVWLFFGREPKVNVLVALVGAFALGSLTTILIRTVFNTVRQMRSARDRDRTARLEREIADMRTKASTLRTRQEPQ